VRAAIRQAATALAEAGVPSPGVDAALLAAFVLDVQRGALALDPPLSARQLVRFRKLVAQRARRIPLQHLTGVAPFRDLLLAVGPGVFVPRPETELLVAWGLNWLATAGPAAPIVVDLCSGSGAIAVSVARSQQHAQVYAVERDPAALAWLRRNAGALPVHVVAGDATEGAVLAELDGRVDLVLANPPYVPAAVAGSLPPEVAHDPPAALFAGPDGLAVIRALVPRIAVLLRPGGAVGLEHDESHASSVAALLSEGGTFRDVLLHHDLAGRPRFTTATREFVRANLPA
jgi:release factor glutamine methyltransferase